MKTRKTKTPHIQPDAVIKAALEILDSEGLENVTLRRLAAKLNVQAPALYWHFKDKSDITNDMAQAILKNAGLDSINPPEDINNWASWLHDLMHSLRNALIAHRDGGRAVAGATFGRAYTLEKIVVSTSKVLEKAGFDKLHASIATGTAIDYVWGFVIEEQAGMAPQAYLSILTQSGENHAYLSSVMDEYSKTTPTKVFDWGLQVIITGLKSTLKETPVPKGKKEHAK
jgi:TetR/AcrR family tetracycline transcriptional repressor